MSRLFARSVLVSALLLPHAAALADRTRPPTATPAEEKPGEKFVSPQIVLGTQHRPIYPPVAFDARYTGSVLLEMIVLKDGKVGNVKVINCTRPKVGFEDAAILAVKQWRFEPGTESGEPVDVVTRVQLNFNRVGIGQLATAQVSAGSFTETSAASAPSSRPATVK